MDGEMPNTDQTAVSLYDQDGSLDDFPVLKAFQQYIDAEQDKARRRMLSLCIFFGCLMTVVVTVFVVLLMHISSRNQALNDRMIEYAMRQREATSAATSPVVVQPPQDSAALLALTTKIDALQKKMAEDQAKTEKAAAEAVAKAERSAAEAIAKAERAAIDAAKPKAPTAEELEIRKLKSLLAAEKERNAAEKDRLRQAELEAYRRKHYPDLYEKEPSRRAPVREVEEVEDEADDTQELLDLVDESRAKTYFSDEEDAKPTKAKPAKSNPPSSPAP